MVITSEQAQKIKEHLLTQLGNFPEEQREPIKKKIISMNNEEIERFIKQNQLNHLNPKENLETNCIFCAIAEKKIHSYILDQSQNCIAVLEINPLSKGHSLIIPTQHQIGEGSIPSNAFILAKKIEQKILEKLKPLEIKMETQTIMGHTILEIIPFYGNKEERHKASKEELEETQKLLLHEPISFEEKIENQPPKDQKKLPILKPRIP